MESNHRSTLTAHLILSVLPKNLFSQVSKKNLVSSKADGVVVLSIVMNEDDVFLSRHGFVI